MPLTEKQEKLVTDNINLVHHFIKKCVGTAPSSPNYEDLVSAGRVGLVYAAKYFDESRGCKFSTYAMFCIRGSIYKEYRHDKRHNVDYTSLDAPIVSSAADKEGTLEAFIEDPNSDFSVNILDDMDLEEILKIILNIDINQKSKGAFLLHLAGMTQDEISAFLGISQPQVSRNIKSAVKEIKECVNKKIQYKEVYEVSVEKERYKISFSSRDVQNFNLIFSTLMEEMAGIIQSNKQSANSSDTDNYPTFKVSCNNERIVILLPRFAESFIFLAKIINKVNNYSVYYIASDGNRVSKEKASTFEKEDFKQISRAGVKKETKSDSDADINEVESRSDNDTKKLEVDSKIDKMTVSMEVEIRDVDNTESIKEESQNENIPKKDAESLIEDVCTEGISLDEEIKTYLDEDSILSKIMKYILMQKEAFSVQDIIDNFANDDVGVYAVTKAIAMLHNYVKCVSTDKPKIYRVVRNK